MLIPHSKETTMNEKLNALHFALTALDVRALKFEGYEYQYISPTEFQFSREGDVTTNYVIPNDPTQTAVHIVVSEKDDDDEYGQEVVENIDLPAVYNLQQVLDLIVEFVEDLPKVLDEK